MYNFHLKTVCDHEFHTIPNPATFLSACIRSKENLSIPAVKQKYLEHIMLIYFIDQHQKQKGETLVSPCVPHPLIKQGTFHLAASLVSHLSHLAISLTPPPLTLHLSQIATSLPSHLSHCATSLFSHLSHLATSLNSYTFPTFPPY